MAKSDVQVVVVGGGSAGVAAARHLHRAGVDCLLVEARSRLGGRAYTYVDTSGNALDLGCGWLHSADHNSWVEVAAEQGATIDKTPPPWSRTSLETGFPRADQDDFQRTMHEFYVRLERAAQNEPDVAASTMLDPASRWNGLINSIGTYITGMDLDRVSAKDFDRYEDTGVNWRVFKGYGTLIADAGAALPQMRDCAVRGIDHSGKRLRIETVKGAITADQAIVTIPTSVLAAESVAFTPALPDKIDAARGLPLGLDNKLFIALDRAEDFTAETRLFGRTDRKGTGGYHLRPFGRPMIEGYFGGGLAMELEAKGDDAFFDFAVSELVGLFGGDFARRLKPIAVHCWGRDPFALGSYSSALPGFADCRTTLATPIDDRLFFAGEACSPHYFSTAHGGYESGVTAAGQAIKARRKS
ncbi:MAG TPA: NAD(P)/FAD-dependent oxidoreductase [Xanthobacteraceae bacterium]|jgi:monoamine oxidase|nr:NAD(P)/FAD-dependent oxidoreductase [Xanthobacteraceae bacterium]